MYDEVLVEVRSEFALVECAISYVRAAFWPKSSDPERLAVSTNVSCVDRLKSLQCFSIHHHH